MLNFTTYNYWKIYIDHLKVQDNFQLYIHEYKV
jgi:hypothetical protein